MDGMRPQSDGGTEFQVRAKLFIADEPGEF